MLLFITLSVVFTTLKNINLNNNAFHLDLNTHTSNAKEENNEQDEKR